MKNLFVNCLADAYGYSLFEAKVRIKTIVWNICKVKLQLAGYTSDELKEAYDIFCKDKLQDLYDTGIIEVGGHEYNFIKLLK